jgi:Tfp pilus assembly protein PilV
MSALMPTAGVRQRSRGVSLIEALVALAVMAFGMLGVVGMQAALRNGADQSKQRSEAVRLAQEEMERLRSFGQTETAPAGELTYALIGNVAASTVTSSTNSLYQGNATFTRSVAVVDHGAASAASSPRMKTLTVAVTWRDREYDGTANSERSVILRSVIAEIAPQLGASLGLPTNRSPAQRPEGRHPSIPRSATPGTGNTRNWVFNNSTGIIENCTPACPGSQSVLLSGFIRFETGGAPTTAEAEAPNDPVPSSLTGQVGVVLNYTLPAPGGFIDSVGAGGCYVFETVNSVRYWCAVPLAIVGFASNYTWSGILDVGIPFSLFAVDPTPGTPFDTDPTKFRVCRYTPDPTTDTPAGGNDAHPLVYTGVTGALTNQNFLIISAGNGTVAYNCPTDSNGNLVNASTKLHWPRAP